MIRLQGWWYTNWHWCLPSNNNFFSEKKGPKHKSYTSQLLPHCVRSRQRIKDKSGMYNFWTIPFKRERRLFFCSVCWDADRWLNYRSPRPGGRNRMFQITEKVKRNLDICFSHYPIDVKWHHNQGTSNKRQHLIRGLLTVSGVQFIIIIVGSIEKCKHVLEKYLRATPDEQEQRSR